MLRRSLIAVLLSAGAYNAGAHSHMPGDESSGLNAMAREFFGGSKTREFIHMFGLDPLPDMLIGTAASKVDSSSNGVKEQTFISPPMTLGNGHIANRWLPIDWPNEHIALSGFAAEVVKAGPNGEAPPPTPCCGGDSHVATREEVFMHHWTVNKWQLPASLFKEMVSEGGLDFDLTLRKKVGYIEFLAAAGLNAGANGPCWDSNLHLFFGIGNEVRTKTKEGRDPYEFPAPYGVEFDAAAMRKKGEFMVLNTHLIDTREVRNKRACTECKCDELGTRGFLNVTTGGLTCCKSTVLDGGKCPTKPETVHSNQTYYIRYTIKWRDFNPATTKPLEVITFDATDNNTKWGDFDILPGGFHESHHAQKTDPVSMGIVNDGRSGDFDGQKSCHVEYYVPACKSGDLCTQRIVNSWELPYPVEVVFLRNHFHSGGINMTTSSKSFNCTGEATYDKTGDLVDISPCQLGVGNFKKVLRIERGERLFTESFYKQDQSPHYGVMAMSFVYAHVPRNQDKRVQDVHV